MSCKFVIWWQMSLKQIKLNLILILEYDYVTWKPRIVVVRSGKVLHSWSVVELTLIKTVIVLPELIHVPTYHCGYLRRRGSRGGEMGEFSPPFFWAPFSLFFLSLKYWNNIWFLWLYYKNSPPISKSWIRPCFDHYHSPIRHSDCLPPFRIASLQNM